MGFKVKKHTRNNIQFKQKSVQVLKKSQKLANQQRLEKQQTLEQEVLRKKMKEFKQLTTLSPQPYRFKHNNLPKGGTSRNVKTQTLKEKLLGMSHSIQKKIDEIQTRQDGMSYLIGLGSLEKDNFYKTEYSVKMIDLNTPKEKYPSKNSLKRGQDMMKKTFSGVGSSVNFRKLSTFKPRKAILCCVFFIDDL